MANFFPKILFLIVLAFHFKFRKIASFSPFFRRRVTLPLCSEVMMFLIISLARRWIVTDSANNESQCRHMKSGLLDAFRIMCKYFERPGLCDTDTTGKTEIDSTWIHDSSRSRVGTAPKYPLTWEARHRDGRHLGQR